MMKAEPFQDQKAKLGHAELPAGPLKCSIEKGPFGHHRVALMSGTKLSVKQFGLPFYSSSTNKI